MSSPGAGFVSLVGAGPGDPGLLTVGGRRALQRADLVLYDRLASPAVLDSVDVPGQERIHVGKTAAPGRSSQEDINRLLVTRALRGQRVVRLKGGDPFVLGRGAEEAKACAEAGVAFEIICGVTSVVAGPAYAGIPLTHRDLSSGFAVLTGHPRGDLTRAGVDWAAAAAFAETLVVLMGVRSAPIWTAGLIAGGRAPTTPVAFVRWATTPRQQTLVTTLAEAPAALAEARFRAPAVAIVGDVVHLRTALSWFEGRPLSGQVIGLTRAASKDLIVFEPATALGAALYSMPLTRKVPTADASKLDLRIAAADFSDLVFTSANAVRAFRAALVRAGKDSRALTSVRTWAVGPQTAKAMQIQLMINADNVPVVATGEGLVALAAEIGVAGAAVLFPAAKAARRVVPDGLAALGADVVEVACYETVPDEQAPARLLSAVENGLSLTTVASPSAVDALAEAAAIAGVDKDLLPLAVIGPTTRAHAVENGFDVWIMPSRFSMADLVVAIIEAGKTGQLH